MPHVLLIEDDPDQRRLRALLLASSGYRVESASSAGEALAILAAADTLPDCVLMDLRLPRAEDGRRLVRVARAHGLGGERGRAGAQEAQESFSPALPASSLRRSAPLSGRFSANPCARSGS